MQPSILPSKQALPPWVDSLLDPLVAKPLCGYSEGGPIGTEPTALAALALLAHGRYDAALPALDWLRERLNERHGVGVSETERQPGWPTGLALLVWRLAARTDAPSGQTYADCIAPATQAILSWAGEALEPNKFVEHDCSLVGWSWVDGTHSWVEPTAIQTLALKAAMEHDPSLQVAAAPRVREAIRLLWDRQLPHGGWNYGNTIVLKQELRPHLLPTGLALLALADEAGADYRVEQSLAYLERELGARTAAVSLGYGVLALSAFGRRPGSADWWLQFAAERSLRRRGSPWGTALLALAAHPDAATLFLSSVKGEE